MVIGPGARPRPRPSPSPSSSVGDSSPSIKLVWPRRSVFTDTKYSFSLLLFILLILLLLLLLKHSLASLSCTAKVSSPHSLYCATRETEYPHNVTPTLLQRKTPPPAAARATRAALHCIVFTLCLATDSIVSQSHPPPSLDPLCRCSSSVSTSLQRPYDSYPKLLLLQLSTHQR